MFSMKKGGNEAAGFSDDVRQDGPGSGQAVTVIARGVILEGNFSSDGPVQIDGEVKGTVSTKSRLTVGPNATITADVTAASASIAGAIKGAVRITEKLQLASTANIEGDITCATIMVEAGALISGKVLVSRPASA